MPGTYSSNGLRTAFGPRLSTCVDHGGFDILVTKKFLNGADIIARFKQVGSKAVTEGMAANFSPP